MESSGITKDGTMEPLRTVAAVRLSAASTAAATCGSRTRREESRCDRYHATDSTRANERHGRRSNMTTGSFPTMFCLLVILLSSPLSSPLSSSLLSSAAASSCCVSASPTPSRPHREPKFLKQPQTQSQTQSQPQPDLWRWLQDDTQTTTTTTTTTKTSPSAEPERPDYLRLDCDPCIARSSVRLRVLLPSSLTHSEHDALMNTLRSTKAGLSSASSSAPLLHPTPQDWSQLSWRQIVASLQQAAADVHVDLDLVVFQDGIASHHQSQADNALQNFEASTLSEEQQRQQQQRMRDFYFSEWRRANDQYFSDDLDALIMAVPPYFYLYGDSHQRPKLEIPTFGMHSVPYYHDAGGLNATAGPQADSARITRNALPLHREDNNIVAWIGHDEYLVGRRAMETLLDGNTNADPINYVAFVTYEPTPPSNAQFTSGTGTANGDIVHARYVGIQETLRKRSPDTRMERIVLTEPNRKVVVQDDAHTIRVEIDDSNVQALDLWFSIFCKYDIVVIADLPSVSSTLDALQEMQRGGRCSSEENRIQSVIALDVSQEIYTAITLGQVQFGMDPQYSLQATMSVVLATLYATTSTTLSMPLQDGFYSVGPNVITQDKIPTDSYVECQTDSFPVCLTDAAPGGASIDFSTYSPTLLFPEYLTTQYAKTIRRHGSALEPALISSCNCMNREKEIRIGGVLHGVTTDSFWDVVFSSAEQAAIDLGNIQLDLERYAPQAVGEVADNSTGARIDAASRVVHDLMAARIASLCASGVDGIFVSIPSETLLRSIEQCLQLRVPVISVNSGKDMAYALRQLGTEASDQRTNTTRNNGIFHHIGMDEYNAGYGAAQRMIEAGMTTGYCLDHDLGNGATADRCRGFETHIRDHNLNSADQVQYGGWIPVAADNAAKYQLDVENAVGASGDWNNIGLLLCGSVQVLPMRAMIQGKRNGAIVATFDVSEDIFEAIADGIVLFGIDQQPFFQGNLAVYLLTYFAYTNQRILDFTIESGPNYVYKPPAPDEVVCQANLYEVCPEFPDEDMNYIPDSLKMLGYVLTSLLFCTGLLALGWTWAYRTKWAVQVSQPQFLALIAIGTLVSSLSIVFMGIQTGYRSKVNDQGQMLVDEPNENIGLADGSCMAVPWLYGMGFVVTFSALFAKIQRVKMIFQAGMQMQRKRVGMIDVVPIMVAMFAIEVGILLSWQLVSPLKWQREILETFQGSPTESVGSCTGGGDGWMFYLGLVTFHVVCLLYALVLCFQTKDISSDLAESSYISLAVMFMFQVLVLAVPISALVQDNTDVFYFVRSSAVFLQNFTVMVLIFVPKILRVQEARNDSSGNQSTRFAAAQTGAQGAYNYTNNQANHSHHHARLSLGDPRHSPVRSNSMPPILRVESETLTAAEEATAISLQKLSTRISSDMASDADEQQQHGKSASNDAFPRTSEGNSMAVSVCRHVNEPVENASAKAATNIERRESSEQETWQSSPKPTASPQQASPLRARSFGRGDIIHVNDDNNRNTNDTARLATASDSTDSANPRMPLEGSTGAFTDTTEESTQPKGCSHASTLDDFEGDGGNGDVAGVRNRSGNVDSNTNKSDSATYDGRDDNVHLEPSPRRFSVVHTGDVVSVPTHSDDSVSAPALISVGSGAGFSIDSHKSSRSASAPALPPGDDGKQHRNRDSSNARPPLSPQASSAKEPTSHFPQHTTSAAKRDSLSSQASDIGYESMLMPKEVKTQWKQLGFQSKEQAMAVIRLVSLDTTPEQRRLAAAALGGLSKFS